jgi:Rad3-related DNA helicase
MNIDDPRLGHPPLPDWLTEFRETQATAIDQIFSAYEAGADIVFLDAPTGAGKTLIAEAIRRLMKMRAIYLCTTKSLQEQFLHDYPYANVIKGRDNYPTLDSPDLFERGDWRSISAGDCTKEQVLLPACVTCETKPASQRLEHMDHVDGVTFTHCNYCHPWEECPYSVVKAEALSSFLAVANTSYFMHEVKYAGQFGRQDDDMGLRWSHPFVIIDEADQLEDELMRFIEFNMSKRLLKDLGIKPPEKKTVHSSWVEWAEKAALPALGQELSSVKYSLRRDKDNPRLMRRKKMIAAKIGQLKELYPRIEEDWVYTGYDYGDVRLKPTHVWEHAWEALWQHGKKFLLMSATIISPDQMAEDLGIDDAGLTWATVRVPSSFPVELRPIYYRGVARMSNKTKETSWPKMAEGVQELMDQYPDDRILVHTMSYGLTSFLAEHLDPYRVLSYQSGKERDDILRLYREQHNAVLLAPSFERGIDLPDEECRVMIVAKIPFPSLGDHQVSKRLYGKGGQGWYAMQTVRSLVQMTGRGVRHEQDYADTYILDSQFLHNTWKRHRTLLPEWWRDAVIWNGNTS